MASFPTGFVNRVEILEPGIGERGDAALTRLHEKGYAIGLGMTEYYAGAVGVMGYQRSIREYCPKDCTEKRFGTLSSTEKWLKKNGGRAPFLLLKDGQRLAAYGWSGVEPCDELPDNPITTAYRVSEEFQGKGLGKDFTQVVVSGTRALYAPEEGIGLETWKSNHAAGMYEKVGFTLVHQGESEYRPTLDPAALNGKVLDQRLYMSYPDALLG